MLQLTFPLISILFSHPPYLDPGSGSFLLQLLIAGLAGVGLFIGASWSKIKKLFRRGKEDETIQQDNDEDEYDD